MAKSQEHGSLTNHMLSRVASPTPKVGDGATLLHWTDREPATVIAVSASGKTITLREDKATRIDANGMSECQTYDYARDPDGATHTARLTKYGWKIPRGSRVLIGRREKYRDFSF